MKDIALGSFDNKLAAGVLFSLLAMGLVLAGCTASPAGSGGAAYERVPTAQAPAVQPAQGRLLFLAPDDQDNLQLTQLPLASNKPMVLTQAPYGIMDYGVSGDGQIVVYSAWREDEGTELWAIQGDDQDARLLVPCENAACGRIAWAPAGNQFTYEKHGGAGGPGTPALWQFDWDTQTTQPMAGEDAQARVNASRSPDGSWFSYFLPDEGVIRVVHGDDGRSYDLPNNLGDPVAWDPAGKAVVSLEIKPDGDQMLARLVRLDLDTGDRKEIGAAGMADRQPAWSPTGEWLAVNRRDWTGAYPSKTQIWLMRGDGTDAHAVLADPDIQYLSPVWSPDGRFLLFQRYSSDQTFVQPEVWMLELETGHTTQVLPSAGQVVWLP